MFKRFAIILIYSFTNLTFLEAQNFELVIYNEDYENCPIELNQLEQKFDSKSRKNVFYLKGQTFSDCAKNHESGVKEYYIRYFENGEIIQEIGYYLTGAVSREFNFKGSRAHGEHLMYYEDGQKYIHENYKNGVVDGPQRRWYGNGQIWRDALYQNGIKIFETIYEKDGTINKED